jgi:hypothetical protein
MNTAVGIYSLGGNISGYNNAAMGGLALGYNTSGYNNSAIGFLSGTTNTTGSNNTFIGNGAAGSSATVNNEITLGNSSVSALRCQAALTGLSDARDKKGIAPLPFGLDFISSLKPVAFTWNTRDGAKVGIKSSGFIAQDLKAAQDAVGAAATLNLVYEKNPDKLESTPGNLIPVLVKAIQEQQKEISSLKSEYRTQIESLKKEIAELQATGRRPVG